MHNRAACLLSLATTALIAGAVAAGTVSGTLQYEDKIFDGGASPVYQGTQVLPIRGAHVEVRSGATWQVVLGTGTTGEDGSYSVDVTDVGAVDARLECYAQMYAEDIRVTDAGGTVHVMLCVLGNIDSSGTTSDQDFVAAVSEDAAGPFNILDCCHTGYDYITALASGTPPPLTVHWDPTTSSGTYYWPDNNSMYLQSSRAGGDPDEFDDGVIIHEYGHVVAFELADDDSPGGPHGLNQHLDPRLAWSEGWATFYSCLVRDNKYYIDSLDGEDIAILLDVEDLSAFPDGTQSDNEVAVSGVLWDIVDGGSDEGFDGLEADFGSTVWDVMENYLAVEDDGFRTLETFWNGWFARGHGSDSYMDAIFSVRGIEYNEDTLEDDDTLDDAGTLAPSAPTEHTIYPAGDEDWVQVDVVSGRLYTVGTTNLANAADTVIELYRPGETVSAATHDDVSDSDLSSLISFNPAAAGMYAVKVYAYVGDDALTRYGSYDLEVSYSTATLPKVTGFRVNESGGIYTITWTYPAGVYDGVLVAYGDSDIPGLEYLQGDFNVVGGTELYKGKSLTSAAMPSGGAAHNRFAAWTYRGGYRSAAVTVGSSDGGGGCFVRSALREGARLE